MPVSKPVRAGFGAVATTSRGTGEGGQRAGRCQRMRMVTFHFWVEEKDGKRTLYEVDYCSRLNKVGVRCFIRIHDSTRQCDCPDKDFHARRLAALMS